MTVPAFNHPCWHRMASGSIVDLKTQHLGTQLMSKRIQRGPESASIKDAELHAYFSKWERVLPSEVLQLAAL